MRIKHHIPLQLPGLYARISQHLLHGQALLQDPSSGRRGAIARSAGDSNINHKG